MKIVTDSSGSNSSGDEEIVSLPTGGESTTSQPLISPSIRPTASQPASPIASSTPSTATQIPFPQIPVPVSDSEKTVISQRPVAAPSEFYRSMPLTELASLLEGKQLDHFQVEQMIGGGGMGAVFRGRDLRLDRIVAIKVIPASKRDADTLRRFRLEAQSAARLDHPNIARVYYVGEAERWNYIVFEYIDGVNVRDLVDMEGPLSVDNAVFYTRQVAEALQHAADRNVVHRDIKPSNLLVTAAGAAKVVDMGLARDTSLDKSSADATASGVTLGTFDYISPEQARNPRDADVRSDLYSLGCTLFFMLTGNPPFPEGTALQKLLNHGSQPPPDPRAWREDLSDELYEIIMKLMAKRPADRYQKPVDLINDLLLLAESENLPRSRSPGTVLLAPSVAQRTLLEANLPWMVAVAILLGTVLWPLSNTFTIPPPNFETAIAPTPTEQAPLKPFSDSELGNSADAIKQTSAGEPISNQPDSRRGLPTSDEPRLPAAPPQKTIPAAARNGDPKGADLRSIDRSMDQRNESVSLPRGANTAIDVATPEELTTEITASENSLTATGSPKSVSTLVVSSRLPADVDRQAWTSSLSDALRRAEVETDIRTIEVVGRVTVDSSLRLARSDLVIRSGTLAGKTPNTVPGQFSNRGTIEFSPSLLARLQPARV